MMNDFTDCTVFQTTSGATFDKCNRKEHFVRYWSEGLCTWTWLKSIIPTKYSQSQVRNDTDTESSYRDWFEYYKTNQVLYGLMLYSLPHNIVVALQSCCTMRWGSIVERAATSSICAHVTVTHSQGWWTVDLAITWTLMEDTTGQASEEPILHRGHDVQSSRAKL